MNELWQETVRAAEDKLAHNTVVLDVAEILGIAETFVITSGTNVRQVRTIADEITEQVRLRLGLSPLSSEGYEDCQWVLIDYGDVVVHVFCDETREFYDLERLWSDAPRLAAPVSQPA